MTKSSESQSEKDNPFISLLMNIGVPAGVLMILSSEDRLGPVVALLVALAFPLGYAAYDFMRRSNFNFVSVIGILGVLMTGGIGLLKLDPLWVAVKEAGIPLVVGIAVAGSVWTRFSLVRTVVGQFVDLERVDGALMNKDARDAFNHRLRYTAYIIAGSFFISAILNYLLARLIVVSPTGTTAFNQELGKMTALSFPVILLPFLVLLTLALIYLFTGIQKHTNLNVISILKRPE